ncbi:MAG: aldo/keto reductase, partial [Gemmatimonadales bacterium]
VLAEVDRDGIFIASKVGWDPGPHDRFYHPRLIEAHLHRSLQNLSVEHIDLYYLHHCDFGPKGEYLDDALLTFRRLRTQGKIRFIGLSDWNSRRVLKYVDRVRPDVIQICRNVCNDEYVESGLKRWADANDVGVVFFSPLDHGLLLGKYTEPTSFPSGDTRNRVDGFRDRRLLLRLGDNREKLIQRFDGHPEPVLHGLMGSLMADSPQACVLVGQRNPDQVRAAVAAAEPVSPTDAAWVNSLYDCETEGGLQSGE